MKLKLVSVVHDSVVHDSVAHDTVVQDSELSTEFAGMHVVALVLLVTERWSKERLMALYMVLLKRSVGLRNKAEMEISVAAAGL